MDVVADIVESKEIGREAPDPLWASLPSACIVRKGLRPFVAPWKIVLLEIAPCCSLPLRFGGQAVRVASLRRQPPAITIALEPRDAGDGLLRMIEIRAAPERRRLRSRRLKISFIFGIGDLRSGEQECVDPDMVDRQFAILTGIGPHEEPPFRNLDETRLDKGHSSGSDVRMSRRHRCLIDLAAGSRSDKV